MRLDSNFWNLMAPGEIYAENEADTMSRGAGTYYVPGPSPMDSADVIARETGYRDSMNQQNQNFNAARMDQISQTLGPENVQAPADAFGFDPKKAAEYHQMEPTDRLAVQMVQSGKMAPEDWYKIQKEDQRKRQESVYKLMETLPLDRTSLQKNGQPAPISGQSLNDLMSGSATVSDIAPPPPVRQIITSTSTTNGGGGPKADTDTAKVIKGLYDSLNEAEVSGTQETIDSIKNTISFLETKQGITKPPATEPAFNPNVQLFADKYMKKIDVNSAPKSLDFGKRKKIANSILEGMIASKIAEPFTSEQEKSQTLEALTSHLAFYTPAQIIENLMAQNSKK